MSYVQNIVAGDLQNDNHRYQKLLSEILFVYTIIKSFKFALLFFYL